MNRNNNYVVHPGTLVGLALRATVAQICILASFFIVWGGFTMGELVVAFLFLLAATFLTMTFIGDLLTIVFNCAVHVTVQEYTDKDAP